MSHKTKQDGAVTSQTTTYIYHIPAVDDATMYKFLRRSQRLASAEVAEAVADYQRRVETGEPYEDAIDADTFRKQYLS